MSFIIPYLAEFGLSIKTCLFFLAAKFNIEKHIHGNLCSRVGVKLLQRLQSHRQYLQNTIKNNTTAEKTYQKLKGFFIFRQNDIKQLGEIGDGSASIGIAGSDIEFVQQCMRDWIVLL